MFDPNDALGPIYDAFGCVASYLPSGADDDGLSCVILRNGADDTAQLGGLTVIAGQMRIEVRASEVALPARGGVFVAGAVRYRIVSAPRRDDPDRLVWTCLCEELQ